MLIPPLSVHLLPSLVSAEQFRGGVVVVIDVLRATTTMAFALANGADAVWPVAEVDAAHALAREFRAADKQVLLGGERGGLPIPGFDLGNSPDRYTTKVCQGRQVIFTTTNGTRALLHANTAERVVTASFANFSAVCEDLIKEERPIHFLCSGTDGQVTLEDTLLAGAYVSILMPRTKGICNDSARLAWDTFDMHGLVIQQALRLSAGGRNLIDLGLSDDIDYAAEVDQLLIVPELRKDARGRPMLITGSVGLERRRWIGR